MIKSPHPTKIERGAYSAIVYQEGDLNIAEDNVGTVIKEDSNATTVIEAAIDSLSSGRTWIETVQCIGNFSISSQIDIPSYTRLDLTEAKITTVGNIIAIDAVATAPAWIEHIEILGGVIDASSQTDDSSSMRVISLGNVKYSLISGTMVSGGGYYGINVWQCNYVTVRDVYCHDNYRHGLHFATDLTGRGWYNLTLGGHYNDNGVYGVDDRGTIVSGEELYNIYIGLEASGNERGVYLGSGSAARDAIYILSDCTITSNTKTGLDLVHCKAVINNVVVMDNGESGVYVQGDSDIDMNNVIVVSNGQTSYNGGLKIVDKDALGATNIVVRGGRISNNWRNLYISTTAGIGRVVLSDIVATGGVDKNFYQSGTVTNLKLRNIDGYVTENNVLSATFAIDSTGVKTVTIAHGLAVTPALEDCYLTVVEDTNVDDWAFNLLKVESVGATNVGAKIHVSTASATGSATAKLALRVGKL